MRIIFVSSLDFGANGAAQNRQRLLIEGLQSHGFEVSLVNPLNRVPVGMPFSVSGLSRWTRLVPRRLAVLLTVIAVLRDGTSPGDLVVCFGRSPLLLIPTLMVTRRHGLRALHEITEHPAEVASGGFIGRVSLMVFERFLLPRLDGVLC